ncbi:MAG: ATP-binding cassette domain-containing protein [bacterium]|nr:ATP-binding cassette domain-containing protein [bacterium]
MEFVLETESLTRDFGSLRAVDHLTFAVRRKEIFGLLGPNGAGKTTIMKMLTTLLPPTAGTASVAGLNITRDAAGVRRAIGYVPQMVSADGTLTGRENLVLSAKLYDIPRGERAGRVEAALHTMGLVDAADRLVRQYSGGMIRRLEIAQAMLHRPSVLFLDEPTVGLDPVARRAVWEYLMSLKTRHPTTVVLTTHSMEEADSLCDRLAILSHGKMAAAGTPLELKASIGPEGATLTDVFSHYTGGELETGGDFHEISKRRRTIRRLG